MIRRLLKLTDCFVLLFAITATGDYKDSFSHYYVPIVRIKDFNVLIDEKNFFDLPVKDEEEAYIKKLWAQIEIMTTQLVIYWILLISKKNYKLIAIDFSKQTKLKHPQQISFIGRLLAARGATMFFVIKKSEEITFEFLQNSASIMY